MTTAAIDRGYNPILKGLLFLQSHLNRRQFIQLLSFLVGVGAALSAQLLKWLIHEIQFLLTFRFDAGRAQWLFLVYPVVGILLTTLFIKYVVRDDIGHGITRILYAISRRQGHIRRHNTWSSILASSLTIGFGGSVGAESPIVLTGSAIGSNLGEIFHLEHKELMLLIGCGASAAIAGIFKAPIAGIVFTLEVLMIDLTMASLLPLLIASLTATCVTYFLTGPAAMFSFHLNDPFVVERVPSSICLGAFCGILSLYFTRAMNWFEQVFGRINGTFKRVALGGTILAILIFFFPPLYGEGYNIIAILLNDAGTIKAESVMNNSLFFNHSEYFLVYLGLILVFKVFATTATNGGGGCGGTFAPSLFMGCLGGYTFSKIWNSLSLLGIYVPERNYALLGMAGLMSGVFHAPLTGVFLIAELTGGYDLFLPLMIVSAVSFLTINLFEHHSIYAMRLARNGELLTHHKDKSILTLITLDAVIDKTVPVLRPEMKLGQIVRIVSNAQGEDFAVVNGAGALLGIINLKALRKVIFRSELYGLYTAEQLMQKPGVTLETLDAMSSVMDRFQETDAEMLPVLDGEGIFVGFASKTRLYSLYRKLMKDFSEE